MTASIGMAGKFTRRGRLHASASPSSSSSSSCRTGWTRQRRQHQHEERGRGRESYSFSSPRPLSCSCLHDRHEDHLRKEEKRSDKASPPSSVNATPGTLEEFLERLERSQNISNNNKDVAGFVGVDGQGIEEEKKEPSHLVHLVGTGPGDPELLTLKAVRLMQQADVVLYDRLISSEVLEYVNKECLMVYVGKERGMHTRSQGEIHELLYRFCTAGATVVRLKGGDPYVFGRGGEELEYLQERGVEVRCVPGITAASGISSALGIPLTHRGIADNVQFITGHLRGEFTDEKLKELAHKVAYENTTIVIYMGLNSLPQMSKELLEHGMDPSTAAVAVERGTMENQRTVFAPLNDLTEMVTEAELQSPTLIIIGNVVTLCPLWQDEKVDYSSGKPEAMTIDAFKGGKSAAAERREEGDREGIMT